MFYLMLDESNRYSDEKAPNVLINAINVLVKSTDIPIKAMHRTYPGYLDGGKADDCG